MIYPKLEPIDVIKLRPGDRVWLRGDVIEPVTGLCFINVVTEHDLVVVQPVQGHTFGHVEDATAVHPLEAENARLRELLAKSIAVLEVSLSRKTLLQDTIMFKGVNAHLGSVAVASLIEDADDILNGG